MIINLNLEFIVNNKITPNEAVILNLIQEGKQVALNRMLTKLPTVRTDLQNLITKTTVTLKDTKYYLSQAYTAMLSGSGLFEELNNKYPTYAYRPNGTKDYLKTNINRCKAKYEKFIEGRLDIHEHILNCLDKEIKERELTGGSQYFKKLWNWLGSEGWKDYEHLLEENPTEQTFMPHGTELG